MKTLIAILALTFMTKAAFAGDNGHYRNCVSASGATQLVLGNVGSLQKNSVMLSIYGRSLGEMVVGESVEIAEDSAEYFRYIELDHDREALLSLQELGGTREELEKGISYIKILGGYNPNKMAPLTTQITVKCQTVYNPI